LIFKSKKTTTIKEGSKVGENNNHLTSLHRRALNFSLNSSNTAFNKNNSSKECSVQNTKHISPVRYHKKCSACKDRYTFLACFAGDTVESFRAIVIL